MRRLRSQLELCQLEKRAVPASFQGLGYLPGGSWTRATGVSSDGQTVVGWGGSPLGQQAWKWTVANGMVGLGDLPGGPFESEAFGISGDGSTVVGYGRPASNYFQGFRYSDASGIVGLGLLSSQIGDSIGFGASNDGSVIVGYGYSNGRQASRWTSATGMVSLGSLSGGTVNSRAYGVSADGAVVVGYSDSASGLQAFRWDSITGMIGLGDLPGGPNESTANAISADASTAVGYSYSAQGYEAFRWTQPTGMVGIGDLPGGTFASEARATSADGTVIVGYGNSALGQQAVRWTAADGIRRLQDVLAHDYGVVIPSGWTLLDAVGCSADGLTIVGYGNHVGVGNEPFVVRLDPPPLGGVVNGKVFFDVNRNGKFDTGEPGQAGVTVFVDTNSNGKVDSGEANAITAADGTYAIPFAVNGSFYVSEIPPSGQTYSTIPDVPVTFFSGNAVSATFGNKLLPPPITVAAGAGAGGGPFVVAYDASGSTKFGFYAYDLSFRGGVRVATGDMNGDNVPDIITAPGPGMQADVRIFSGVDGKQIGQLIAFDAKMTVGAFVAIGDVDGDGHRDIIVGAGTGVEPRVRVFSGADLNGAPIREFVAYPNSQPNAKVPYYAVGVNVSAGDFNNDGKADIVTGPEAGNPHVKVFNGANPAGPVLREFFAFNPIYPVGASVTVGDFDGDGHLDIVTGAGAPGGPHVKAFSGVDGSLLREFYAYQPGFTGGVRVAMFDLDFDGRDDIVTGGGPNNLNGAGVSNSLRMFDHFGYSFLDLTPFGSFLGGMYVG